MSLGRLDGHTSDVMDVECWNLLHMLFFSPHSSPIL